MSYFSESQPPACLTHRHLLRALLHCARPRTHLARHPDPEHHLSVTRPALLTAGFQANGVLLDSQRIRLRVKLVAAYGFLTFVMAASTVWLLANSVILSQRDKPVFDWTNSGWAAWWIPAVFGQAAAWVAYGYSELRGWPR